MYRLRAVLIATLLTACTATSGELSASPPPVSPSTTPTERALEDGAWVLDDVVLDVDVAVPRDAVPTLVVTGDEVTGDIDCNYFDATVDLTVPSGEPVFEDFQVSEVLCTEDHRGAEFYGAFQEALRTTTTIERAGQELRLVGPAGELTFVPDPTPQRTEQA